MTLHTCSLGIDIFSNFTVQRWIDLVIRGKETFKNSGSHKILVDFHGVFAVSFLLVTHVSQSRFLYKALSES